MLQILQGAGGKDADGLAVACGVSRRTVFRDLETLRSAGVPLEFDAEENCYSITHTFFLPPTNFTAEEALSLIVLAGSLGRADQVPFLAAARSAVLKIQSTLPPGLRDQLQQLTQAIQVRWGQVGTLPGQKPVYQQLVDAIALGQVVRIHYASLTEWEEISTKLRAYQLLFCNHSWYVIGRSSLHREIRTFNLQRITQITPLSSRYSIPRSFSLDKHLGNAWRLIPDPRSDEHVVVRFQPLVAQNVAEVLWHRTQSIKRLADGGVEFHARVSGFSEIAWWILGYGDQAEVVRPAKLRKLIAERVLRMRQIYHDA